MRRPYKRTEASLESARMSAGVGKVVTAKDTSKACGFLRKDLDSRLEIDKHFF